MTSADAYVLTFNCGRALIQPEVFSKYLWNALPTNNKLPGILVLCLQEIAPICYSFLGGSSLTPYFNAFREAVKLASKDIRYVNLITRNVGMTGIMVFLQEESVPKIEWLQTAGVGVGLQGMGNKGAAAVRMGYRTDGGGVLSLTFISAHLAAMEDALEKRDQDYENIARGLVFQSGTPHNPPSQDEQEEETPLLQEALEETSGLRTSMYATTYLFFAGDLNYRTSTKAPTAEDIENFPAVTSDEDNDKHFSHLLAKDQLKQQLEAKKTLHGLTEAPIHFPPTYKYQNKTAPLGEQNWKWAGHRWPSWCDRILYLDLPSSMSPAVVKTHLYTALPLFATSDHRPVALSISIPLQPTINSTTQNEDIRDVPPFPTDAQWQVKRDAARRKEIVVGIMAYLGLTWEGNGLVFAIVIGIIGGWLVLSSLIAV